MSEKPEDKPVPYHITAPNYKQADTSLLGEEHIRVYRETNGETGYIWNGSPILLMTYKGRKTGIDRTMCRNFEQAQLFGASIQRRSQHFQYCFSLWRKWAFPQK